MKIPKWREVFLLVNSQQVTFFFCERSPSQDGSFSQKISGADLIFSVIFVCIVMLQFLRLHLLVRMVDHLFHMISYL